MLSVLVACHDVHAKVTSFSLRRIAIVAAISSVQAFTYTLMRSFDATAMIVSPQATPGRLTQHLVLATGKVSVCDVAAGPAYKKVLTACYMKPKP